ncbi:lebocin-4-like [Amyelois transitella]|uniref:lebocin-4-like n=1 Tax=Amyelois transitella TaxID=680683 RepID=UPI00298FA1F3|nr:lebocin-4-like [Amyelois transitella]
MLKLVLFVLGVFLVAESSCQRFVQPTFRPPPRKPILIRKVRAASDDEPLWLYKGDNIDRAPSSADHPFLPQFTDDVKLDPNRRYARSLDSPSAKRGGGSHSTSSGSRDTGATHPGHNRRNARSIRLPEQFTLPPFFPKPPRPITDTKPFPIYARVTRDIQLPGVRKPSHRDVIIPNWNPNVRTNPWQRFGVSKNRRH